MTIDDEGNVYLTGSGVTVFDKTRQADRANSRGGDRGRQRDLWRAKTATCFSSPRAKVFTG